jgi:hypothetical protein
MTNTMIDRQAYATIRGRRYPVECIGLRRENGYKIVKVRVLPRDDGFQPKPFVTCRWSAPFVYSDEGEVLADHLDVEYSDQPCKQVMMTSVNGRVQLNPAWCKHGDTQAVTSGGYFTSMGEADDDVHETLICQDCGIEVEEPQGNMAGDDSFGGEG